MKRPSFAVFFLISVLIMLPIPELSAQIFTSEFGRLRYSGCASQSPQALRALDAAPWLENFSGQTDAENQSGPEVISSHAGLNAPGFMGFYNACSPRATVHVYHGENAQEELSLYHVPIDDFTANLFADWSWDPVNSFEPNADLLIERIHLEGSATENIVPFWYGSGTDALAPDGLLKQTAISLTAATGRKLPPGVYFLQFSTPGFEHSHASSQSIYRTKYFINIATAALTVKRSGGQLLVWAVDVNSGEALADERIDIYGADAALLASGLTDESGVLKLEAAASSREVLAVLKSERHFALGYTDWDTDIFPEGQRYIDDAPRYQVHVYTDRQVYLPGHRVYFHGVVRVKDDMRYSLPGFKTVAAELRDGYGTVLQKQELQLNDFGSFHGVFDADGFWEYGPYEIQVTRGADAEAGLPYFLGDANHSFTVARYIKLSTWGNSSEAAMETHASTASDVSSHSVDGQDMEKTEPVRLIGEKTQYKIGERAQIRITSPFEGEAKALVTIEREDVISYELITLPDRSLTYEIEILPEHVPNIYLSVFFLSAISADEPHPVAAYQMGLTELRVDTERQALNIDISRAGQSVSSPGKTRYEARVTDYKGDPVAAEVSVALVDPAAHSPLPHINASLLAAFYGRQQLSVSTSSALVASAEGEPGALRFSGCCGGGCGGQIYFEDPTIHDAVVETSYWNPTLRANSDGEATFELDLPASLQSWRLDVRAITDSADGSLRVGEKTFDLQIDFMD